MLSHNTYICVMHKVRRECDVLIRVLCVRVNLCLRGFVFSIHFSGESAFHAMMHGFGWAKHPMLRRMHNVRHDKPITLLYGSRSWIDKSSWDLLKAARESNYVNVQVNVFLFRSF